MSQINLTPGQSSDSGIKSMFFDIYEGVNEEEATEDVTEVVTDEIESSEEPQASDDDNQDESEDTVDNDDDDDEYEIVEVEEDEIEEGDEIVSEDDSEDGSEASEEVTEESEEGDDSPGYLYFDEEEGRDIFMKAVDPATGKFSVYLNREEAERGLGVQVAYIEELKKQVEETRNSNSARVAELQKELALYQSGTSPEAAKEILVQAEMPEVFKNVDPATLSDEDLRKFKNARLDAEIKVERTVRESVEQQQAADKANAEAQDRADQHVRSRKTDLKFFGMKNVEDQVTINQKLAEKPEGSDFTYSEIVTSVAKAFGNKMADEMLLSIVKGTSETTISTETPEAEAEPKKVNPKKAKPKAEQVQKVKKKVRRKKAKASNSTKPTPDFSKMSPKDILNDAFKSGKQPPVKRR